MVLEKTLESPLDCKEIQPVNSEGDQPWVFFRRNDAKAETPVLWNNIHNGLFGCTWDSELGRKAGERTFLLAGDGPHLAGGRSTGHGEPIAA